MLPRISKVECEEVDYLLFSTGDIISNTLFRTGKWEDHLFQISKFFISGIFNPLILDIGANLGAYSIPLAKYIQNIGGGKFLDSSLNASSITNCAPILS